MILDGVFSHTGSDSVYFNREGRYPTQGAYNSQQSPYYPWYTFRQWPNSYDCWWNFDTLPNVQETNPSYDAYINGKEASSASGWRRGPPAGGWTWPTSCPTTLSRASTGPPGRPTPTR